MKSKTRELMNNRTSLIAIALAIVLSTFAIVPVGKASSAKSLMSINVVNNSNRIIRHLYLVQTEQSAWGPDLMNQDASLTTGQTFTITDVSCATNEIKVIAEDPQGCFMYGTVSCAEASNTWTITNDTPLDCGN